LKNFKFAHFIDDEKFPDYAYELFETVAPGCNDFYLPSEPFDLKYIKKIPVKFISKFTYKNSFFLKKLENYDFVVLHALTEFNQQLVLHTDTSKVTFVWIGMGYDYYDLIYDDPIKSLLLPATKSIAYKLSLSKASIQKILNFALKKIFGKPLKKRNAVKKIHYFSPVLESEYYAVKDKFNNIFPQYIRWNYETTANLIDKEDTSNIFFSGHGILLGNSATFTNNHIEIIDFLSNIKLNNKKVICPLSYGDPTYANFVIKYAKSKLGKNFIPLNDFLPYDNYIELISSCSNVIMNNIRQQGAGNIIAMLRKGAKVYLREENPLYQHFNSMGVKIFTIQNLLDNPKLLEKQLSKEDIQNNRIQTINFSGAESAIDKTKNLIKKVTQQG